MEKYTLEDAKNEIAKKLPNGYRDWDDMLMFMNNRYPKLVLKRLEQAAELFAKKQAIEFGKFLIDYSTVHKTDSILWQNKQTAIKGFFTEQELYDKFNNETQ